MNPRVAIASLTLAVMMIGTGGCGSAEPEPVREPPAKKAVGFVPDTKPVPVVRWLDATVPKGTVLKLSLIDSLGSASTGKGEEFRCLVTDAIMENGLVTVPSGSNVIGVIGDVVPATPGFKGKGGMLLLEFNRIATPTGASAPLKARLSELKAPRSTAFLAGPSNPGAVVAGARDQEVIVEPTTPLTIVLEDALAIKVKQ